MNEGSLITGHIVGSIENSEEGDRAQLRLGDAMVSNRTILGTCHFTMTRYPDESNPRKDAYFGTQSRAQDTPWWGRHSGRRSRGESISQHSQS